MGTVNPGRNEVTCLSSVEIINGHDGQTIILERKKNDAVNNGCDVDHILVGVKSRVCHVYVVTIQHRLAMNHYVKWVSMDFE